MSEISMFIHWIFNIYVKYIPNSFKYPRTGNVLFSCFYGYCFLCHQYLPSLFIQIELLYFIELKQFDENSILKLFCFVFVKRENKNLAALKDICCSRNVINFKIRLFESYSDLLLTIFFNLNHFESLFWWKNHVVSYWHFYGNGNLLKLDEKGS